MQRKHIFVVIAASLGLAGAIAFAANRGVLQMPASVVASTTSGVASANAIAPVRPSAGFSMATNGRTANKPPGPTVDEVGDLDSFGRNLIWLGATGTVAIHASSDCSEINADYPGDLCRQIVNPAVSTSTEFPDIARIVLPGGVSNSILCPWFTQTSRVRYMPNPGPDPAQARFVGVGYMTVENSVLNNPSMIDATTGAPFGGRLMLEMSSGEYANEVLPPNLSFQIDRFYDRSLVCRQGLSKRVLVELYGLTQSQADDFFRQPTTIRLNYRGSLRNVEYAYQELSLRLIGD